MRGRMFLTFLCCILAVFAMTYLLPGITVDEPMQGVVAGLVLGAAYLILRPVARAIAFPIGCLTFGLINFAIDIGIIYLLDRFVAGFHVAGVWWALLASLILNAIIMIVGGLAKEK